MTRLTSDDVRHIPETINSYNCKLRSKIGRDLLGLAKHAVKYSPSNKEISKTLIAVVPCTAGLGLIEGFSEAVAAILTHLGFKAFITEKTDISGFVEALDRDAHIIFSADDNTFAAIIPGARRAVDNSEATGLGYAAALELAAEKLNGMNVGVIGVGSVGISAVCYLVRKVSKIYIFDVDQTKIERVVKFHNRLVGCNSLEEVLANTKFILLAAPAEEIITEDKVCKGMIISAPGVPLGVDERALVKITEKNLIHDRLEIGVATMAIQALKISVKF